MNQATQLATRFSELFLNGKWIAQTNYKEQLSDLTWQQATQQIDSFNTIAALTFHVNYYVAGVLNVLKGGTLDIRDQYSFDLPEITTQESWEKLVQDLLSNAEQFAQQVHHLSDEQLAAVFVKAEYGNYSRNIEGIIEHSYYHLGQITLLKKWISTG